MKTTAKWIGAGLALVLAAVFAVSETTGAIHHRRAEGMFGGPAVRILARQLDLTDAQRTQIHQLMAKEKPTVQPLMKQMVQGRLQIAQLEVNGNFDEAQVRTLATQQAQTMSDLIVQRARIENEMVQVLTPDQKTKLTQILANWQQKRGNHTQNPTPAQ